MCVAVEVRVRRRGALALSGREETGRRPAAIELRGWRAIKGHVQRKWRRARNSGKEWRDRSGRPSLKAGRSSGAGGVEGGFFGRRRGKERGSSAMVRSMQGRRIGHLAGRRRGQIDSFRSWGRHSRPKGNGSARV